ncbi:hypothetical protein CEW87_18345 [Parazoarcus communis]|uniref:Uncharacterized protein n=1 Tax=Parazoarcus communis TaxID=41977 RepID=A0A2U8H5R3_9RHOO|nr:hypothetical protein [Parazoarcus communis]AWI81151.1 hypothetical protein CEW87_18345 [Parazoarcus communis]
MNTALVIAILSLAAGAVVFVKMQRCLGKLKPNIISLQLTFSEASFRNVPQRWGTDGVTRFKAHFALDYVFLLTYAIFGFSLGAWLTSYISTPGALSAVLPWLFPVAAVFDAAENVLHQRLASADPGSQPEVLFIAAGVAASVKWLLLLSFVPVAAVAAFANAG